MSLHFCSDVTVRTSCIAADGHYPLPVRIKSLCVRTFLHIAAAIMRYNFYTIRK